jgi:hypothetical protein
MCETRTAGPARSGPAATAADHPAQPLREQEALRLSIAEHPDELAARRELRAWRRAAEHLNRRGYAAAVPAHMVEPLRRYGLVVWSASGRRVA